MHLLNLNIYIYIYIYMQSWKQYALPVITTMASWQLMHMYSCTSCAQVYELPQSHCGNNQDATLFSWLHTYYAHLASVRFEHSVCRGSLMTTYDHYRYVHICIHVIYISLFIYMYICKYINVIYIYILYTYIILALYICAFPEPKLFCHINAFRG